MQPLLLKKNKLTIHQRILEYKMLIKFTDQNQNKDDKLDFPQKLSLKLPFLGDKK